MPAPRRLVLPRTPKEVVGCYWRPSRPFLNGLAGALKGQRVLEVFAGNGYLAAWLSTYGVSVTATSVLSGADMHSKGVYADVVEMTASAAVSVLGPRHDVLLMSWPTVTPDALRAALSWSKQAPALRPICFIGEVTDPAKGHFGGCASDEFFEAFVIEADVAGYKGLGFERACLGRLRQT